MGPQDGLVNWVQCFLRLGLEAGFKWAHKFIIGKVQQQQEQEEEEGDKCALQGSVTTSQAKKGGNVYRSSPQKHTGSYYLLPGYSYAPVIMSDVIYL